MALTKEIFMKFIRCYKMGYLELYYADKKTVHYESSFKQDEDMVKSFGKELFKGGVENNNSTHAINTINSPSSNSSKIIYDASFETPDNNFSFTADVLAVSERFNWLIQFNPSLMILLPEHIFEMGFLWKVLNEIEKQRKIQLKIGYLNRNYARESMIDIDQLFVIEDVTTKARDNQTLVNREIDKINKVIARGVIPTVKVGRHCTKPYKCDFFDFCWAKVPQGSIYNISGLTSKQVRYLEENEIDNIKDIPDNFRLSNRTLTEIKAVFRNKPILKRNKIQNWFNTIDSTGPISFINIETIQPAIPLYRKCKPYEVLPYMYTLLYRSNAFMDFQKSSYLADINVDPRLQFLENLISDIKSAGPIVTFNYHKTVTLLDEVNTVYPIYRNEVNSIIGRLWDLGAPANNGWYFHHSLNKSKSLQTVLASLDNDIIYRNLKIANSNMASAYYRLITAMPIRKEGQIVQSLKEFSLVEVTTTFTVFEIFNSM